MHTAIHGGGELEDLPALIKQYGVDNVNALNTIANEYLSRLNLLEQYDPFPDRQTAAQL